MTATCAWSSLTSTAKAGFLLATLHGKDPKAGAILLMAHIDVVEANRKDWKRDPFKLVEEGGYFYARGARTTKPWRRSGPTPYPLQERKLQTPRDLKLAPTCGEETASFNSVPSGWCRSIQRHEGPTSP